MRHSCGCFGRKIFGPGNAQLLETLNDTGSLAARQYI
jgi:molybdenum-dependent DNA-binding transcriptional regulator ModE